MFWEKHEDEKYGYKIWLSQDDVGTLLDHIEDDQTELAVLLGVRSGLRSDEIVRVEPKDVRDTEAGYMLRVDGAKGGGLRQTPVPDMVAGMLRGREPADEPVIGVTTRTLRNWTSKLGEELAEENDEPMWAELSPHDFRRTWATALDGADVNMYVALDWGGWTRIDTFLDHYRGTNSPEVQAENRERVEWL